MFHTRIVAALMIALTLAAAASAQKSFEFIKYESPIRAHSGYHPNAVAFSSDGKLMASGADDAIAVWDVATQKLLTRMQLPEKQYAVRVAFTDGKTLVSNAVNDRMIRFWDVRTGKQLKEFPNPKTKETPNGYSSPLIAFSTDGALMAVHDDWRATKVLETVTGKVLSELPAQAGTWNAYAFSADGQFFATGSAKEMLTMRIWNPQNGERVGRSAKIGPAGTAAIRSPPIRPAAST